MAGARSGRPFGRPMAIFAVKYFSVWVETWRSWSELAFLTADRDYTSLTPARFLLHPECNRPRSCTCYIPLLLSFLGNQPFTWIDFEKSIQSLFWNRIMFLYRSNRLESLNKLFGYRSSYRISANKWRCFLFFRVFFSLSLPGMTLLIFNSNHNNNLPYAGLHARARTLCYIALWAVRCSIRRSLLSFAGCEQVDFCLEKSPKTVKPRIRLITSSEYVTVFQWLLLPWKEKRIGWMGPGSDGKHRWLTDWRRGRRKATKFLGKKSL